MDNHAVDAFTAASRFFVEAVGSVPPDRYEQRWSDEWRVLDLIGHGHRANLLTVEYYERPVPVAGPEYVLPENIAARGREAVAALGDDPVAAVRAASDRAVTVVAAAPDDAVVGTPFGTVTLEHYLRSRTAELVLHGLDLETSVEPPVEPPAEALEECAAFLAERAIQRGQGVEIVRALTGRGVLEPGFTVY